MDSNPTSKPKPDYTRLWNEYCKRTPLEQRMNQVEFIRWIRSGEQQTRS